MTDKKVVVYVPLDDRPCNNERVQLAGKSMGIEILFPPKDYFKNCLDNQPLNSTGSQLGSPDLILEWLRNISQSRNIDAYLVSLDQINSGGLIGSRVATDDDISTEKNRIVDLMSIIGNKPAYFFDTIMRLASTLGFQNMGMYEYISTRLYASHNRMPFRHSDKNIRKDHILNYYDIDGADHIISYQSMYNKDDGKLYTLTREQVNKYLTARKRKFKLNAEILEYIKGFPNAYISVGVDDSSHRQTIQENEISYIEDFIVGSNNVFAGADEIAMCLLSRIATDLYRNKPSVRVVYFGGAENEKPDNWDFRSLKFNVDTHIRLSGGTLVTDDRPVDMEVLVLTKPRNGKTHQQNSNDIHWHINNNNTNNILTSVIDASSNPTGDSHFQRRLLGNFGSPIQLTKLLAYSSWNTVGNAIGMSIGHGIGRTAFIGLNHDTKLLRYALEGQAKLLFTEYAKDICYKVGTAWYINKYLVDHLNDKTGQVFTKEQKEELPWNFYKYGVKQNETNLGWGKNCLLWSSFIGMTTGDFNIHKLASIFYTNGDMFESYIGPYNNKITKVNWVNYPYENGDSAWFHLVFPWHRTFECTFPLNVSFK